MLDDTAISGCRKLRTTRHRAKGPQRRRQRALLLRRHGPWCQICGAPFTDDNPPTLDHIIPVSRGGRNEVNNMRLACQPCNVGRHQ